MVVLGVDLTAALLYVRRCSVVILDMDVAEAWLCGGDHHMVILGVDEAATWKFWVWSRQKNGHVDVAAVWSS